MLIIARGMIGALVLSAGAALAQRPLTPTDSVALVNAIVADLRAGFALLRTGPFVVDSTSKPGPWAVRIVAGLRSGDFVWPAMTRTTPRVVISELSVFGDTATTTISLSRCREGSEIAFSVTGATLSYVRAGDQWVATATRRGSAGDGHRCPW